MRGILHPSDAPALIDATNGEVISRRELVNHAQHVASVMGPSRQLVMLSCRNDVATLTVYAACLLGGHAVMLVDGTTDAEAIDDLVRTYRPSVVAGSPSLIERLSRPDPPWFLKSMAITDGIGISQTTSESPPQLHRDLAVLLSTSGTTGSRKFVRLSMRNVESNAQSIAEYLGLTPDERPITSLPLHYSFGLSVVNSHWLAGAPVVVTDESVMWPGFWDAFRRHTCTSMAGVPFSYRILERLGFRNMDLPSLTTMQQAGGALDRGLTATYHDFMASRGGRFFVMYGQTEATARIAYVPPERLTEKLGSAGIPIPGGRLRIDAPAVSQTGGPATGEVVYEGPNVMLGYATSHADLASADELEGVLRTGDIGYLDAEGYLFLVGREKRIAKVFGHRINLDEIEALIGQHGPVAVVDGGEAIWVFCAFPDVEKAADTLARRLRLHRSAIVAKEVGTLPLTTSGKPDYKLLKRWATGGVPVDTTG